MKNSIIIILLFINLAAKCQFSLGFWNFSTSTPDYGVAAWYPFNGNVNDSINSNDGTAYNSPSYISTNDRSEQSGKCLTFSGSTQYVDLGNPSDLQITGDMSISAWVKTSSGLAMRILSKDDGTNNSYSFGFNSSSYPFMTIYNSGTAKSVIGSTARNNNGWTMVTTTYNATSGEMRLYVGGKYVTHTYSGVNSIDNDPSNVNIARRSSAVNYWNGSLDDIIVYDKLIDSTSIDSLYRDRVPQTNLEAWYRLNGAYLDRTYNGHTGSNGFGNFTTDKYSVTSRAREFLGVIDYCILDNFSTELQSSFSWSLWFQADDGQPAATYYLTGVNCSIGSDIFNIAINTDGTIATTYKANAQTHTTTTSSAVLSDGVEGWHHLVVVYDFTGTKATIYFDGTSVSTGYTGTALSSITTTNFSCSIDQFLGASNDGYPNGYFDGKIDDVKLYTTAIGQSVVDDLKINVR